MTNPIPGADSERAMTHREYMEKCKSLRHDPTVLAWIANYQKRALRGVAVDCHHCGFPHAAALVCGSGSYFGQFVMGADTYYVDTSNLLFLLGLVGKLAPAGAFHWREGKFFTRTEKGVEISFYEKYNNTPQKKVWAIPAMEWGSIVEQMSARAAAKVGANVAADCPKCAGSSIVGEVRGVRCSNCEGRGYVIAAGAPAETPKQGFEAWWTGRDLPDNLKPAFFMVWQAALEDGESGPFAAQPAPAPIAGDVENDARDAQRYRFLRDNSARQFQHPIVVEQKHVFGRGMQYFGPTCGNALDKAVDAAMLANSSSGEAG